MSIKYPQLIFTSFPDTIQALPHFEDINSGDISYYNNYIEALKSGDLPKAQQQLASMPNLDNKILTSEKFNRMSDTLSALQQFFKSDIQSFLNTKQQEWEKLFTQFEMKGTWNEDTSYKKNNMVTYEDTAGNTFVYVAINDVTGGADPSTDSKQNPPKNWICITYKGDKGFLPASTSFAFNWSASQNYGQNTIVVYENQWWLSIKDSTNIKPNSVEGEQYWRLVLDLNPPQYAVSPTPPSNIGVGELWFKEV